MASVSDRRRIATNVLAIAVTSAALWLVLGPIGIAIAGVMAITMALTSPIYAFAVGQLLFVVLLTAVASGVAVETLVGAQLGFAVVLLSALLGRWPPRVATVSIIAFAVAAAGLAAVYLLETVWHGVAVLTVGYAFIAYTLHRYELARLGLVPELDQ